MTREEAITRLKNMAWLYGSAEREQNIEAIDMAIEALQAEQNYVHIETYRDLYEKYIELKHKSAEAEWIPCSERLPEDSGDYLVCPSDGVIEDYSDCSDVMIMPYDADCEAFGWWTERYDPISLGFVDSDFNEFEVVAWMPLPEPYREDGEE